MGPARPPEELPNGAGQRWPALFRTTPEFTPISAYPELVEGLHLSSCRAHDLKIKDSPSTSSGKAGFVEPDLSQEALNQPRLQQRRFELADYVKVSQADMEDGLLIIDLLREVPDAMKPRKIAIGGQAALSVVEGDGASQAA